MISFNEQQSKILVNSSSQYDAYVQAMREVKKFEGWMRWKLQGKYEYLTSGKSGGQNQKSHGRRSSETEDVYSAFIYGKDLATNRLKDISEPLQITAAIAKALSMGKIPNAFAKIIRQYDIEEALENYLMVAGTHAIYCYESMTGVWLDSDLGATEDLDLVWAGLDKAELITVKPPRSLLGTLKSIDSTYTVNQENRFQVRNSKGLIIDFITSQDNENKTIKEYLKPIGIVGQDWLSILPPVTAIVFDSVGLPVRLCCPDPRIFALHKLWVSNRVDRNPLKKNKDQRQGKAVIDLALQYLPSHPFDAEFRRLLPPELQSIMDIELKNQPLNDTDGASTLDLM